MNPKLCELVLQCFDSRLPEVMPGFEVDHSKSFLGPGRLYIDQTTLPNFFIFVQISEKRDAFTVELAWNVKDDFPPSDGYRIPRDWPEIAVKRTDLDVSEFRFRLSKLWAKPKYDPWWEFSPRNTKSSSVDYSVIADQEIDDSEKCLQLVTDALDKLLTVGLPYINEIRTRSWLCESTERGRKD